MTGGLICGFYQAGKTDEAPSETAYVDVWADWEWQNDAPFVQQDLYPELKRFFEYYDG